MKISRPESVKIIPVDAKLKYNGKIFEIYQWKQTLFDGRQKVYEGLKRKDSVNIILIKKKNKIILSRQQQSGMKPFISGFGGKIEKGETILQAAKRELLEETGYKANKWKLWFATQPTELADWTIYTFLAGNLERVSSQNLESGEKIKNIIVTPNQLLQLSKVSDFRDKHISLYIYQNEITKKKLSRLIEEFCIY